MIDTQSICGIVGAYPPDRRYAMAMLQDMQRRFNFIPPEGLESAAARLQCPVAELYAMATFYKAFSLTPKGKHIIKLCDGTACHIRQSARLLDGVRRVLGIGPGEVTPDGLFSVELVNCLGSCALAPVMVVDETYFGRMTLEKLPGIFDRYRGEAAL